MEISWLALFFATKHVPFFTSYSIFLIHPFHFPRAQR